VVGATVLWTFDMSQVTDETTLQQAKAPDSLAPDFYNAQILEEGFGAGLTLCHGAT